jgi:thiamine monophosphate kinase
MVGGELAWPAFAKLIKRHLAPVPQDKKRVLCLSCCHSSDGLSKMASELRGHFTAAYHFTEDKIAFATAMATWAMFYSKKKLAAPHAKTREAINTFFQKSVLGFREL